jgi:hypothetical protein
MAYKLRRRNLRPLCLACAAILGALCLLYWALTSKRLARDDRRPDTAPVVNPGDPAPVRPAAIRALPRAIYPYSVIRGGAYSAAELVAALRADPMAAHYAGFDPSQTRMTRAPAAAAVHVSYRQGNRIYWTRRKVHLAAGEPLLTDGVHTARARCGNRISPTPAEPAQAPEPDTDLDIPEPAAVPPDVFSVTKVVHEIFPALPGELAAARPPGRQRGAGARRCGRPRRHGIPDVWRRVGSAGIQLTAATGSHASALHAQRLADRLHHDAGPAGWSRVWVAPTYTVARLRRG